MDHLGLQYLQQTLWMYHATPSPHFLSSNGIDNKNCRKSSQVVVGTDFLPLTGIMQHLRFSKQMQHKA